MSLKMLMVVLISKSVIHIINAKRNFVIIQHKFETNSYHSAVITNATINYLRNNLTSIDLYANLTQSFPSLYGHVGVTLIRGDQERFTLFNKTNVNLCTVLGQNTAGLNLLDLITREALKNGYLPRGCPPVKSDLYHVLNFTIDPDIFPAYTPEARFETYIQLLSTFGKKKKEMIMDIVYNGEFRYKKKRWFRGNV